MKAMTLVELTITLTIAIAFTAIAVPIFSESRRDAQMAAFASEICGELTTARLYAQMSGRSVSVNFDSQGPFLFQTRCGEILLSSRKKQPPRADHYPRLQLPPQPITHPTSGQVLEAAFRSTHGNRIVFGARGSSSATLTFSMDDRRVLCIVVSGSTGRFRAYLLAEQNWVPFQ